MSKAKPQPTAKPKPSSKSSPKLSSRPTGSRNEAKAADRFSHRTRKPDRRWLFCWILLLVLLTVAIVVNLNSYRLGTIGDIARSLILDTSDEKTNWERYQTYDIELDQSLHITQPGNYHLTGTLSDGAITIDAERGKVRLILDNVTIKNSHGPAIVDYSAEDVLIELVGDNYLEDSAEYSTEFASDVVATLYARDDLNFRGDGSLTVKGNHADGIVCKDDLKLNSGTFIIDAKDDGIRGKDAVQILSGSYTINSTADAIKTTNETDNGKGFIMIKDGFFNLSAGAKGIKSTQTVLIYGGNFQIDSYDDAIHSDNRIGLAGGNIQLSAGDDAIHANELLVVDGANLDVKKSKEGLEARNIYLNDGEITVIASDDGINAGSGQDKNSATTTAKSPHPMDADPSCTLNINGGNIYVNSGGDGVDSNGHIYFNGGKTIVDGPTNNGNGALDSGTGITQRGGEVIALGNSGMAENLGAESSVVNASIFLSNMQSSGTVVEIKNSAGETIISHISAKTFNHIAVGTTSLSLGQTYTVYLNGIEDSTFTTNDILTTTPNSAKNLSPGKR